MFYFSICLFIRLLLLCFCCFVFVVAFGVFTCGIPLSSPPVLFLGFVGVGGLLLGFPSY